MRLIYSRDNKCIIYLFTFLYIVGKYTTNSFVEFINCLLFLEMFQVLRLKQIYKDVYRIKPLCIDKTPPFFIAKCKTWISILK